MESAEPHQLVFDFWPLLSQWLGHYWPWIGISGLGILLFTGKDWLLAQSWGRFWPVPAAFLPALIPFARDWQKTEPSSPLKGCIVPALLLAVAVLQIYGQERNNDDRDQQATRIDRIAAGVEQQGVEVNRIGADIRRLADAIADLAAEAQEETSDVEVD